MSEPDEPARPTIQVLPGPRPPADEGAQPVRVPEGVPSILPLDVPGTVPAVLDRLHVDVLSALKHANRLLDVPLAAGDIAPGVFAMLAVTNRRVAILDTIIRDVRMALGIVAGIEDRGADPQPAPVTIREMRDGKPAVLDEAAPK